MAGHGRAASASTLPGEPGPLNAITDVGGVEVGVTTLIGGTATRRRQGRSDRRHRDSAARPRRGRPAMRRGLVLAQRQRRDDRHHLDRRGRIVQSACRAVEYARGRRLPHRRRQLGQPRSIRGSPGSGCCPSAPRPGTATSTTSTAATSDPSTSRRRSTRRPRVRSPKDRSAAEPG